MADKELSIAIAELTKTQARISLLLYDCVDQIGALKATLCATSPAVEQLYLLELEREREANRLHRQQVEMMLKTSPGTTSKETH